MSHVSALLLCEQILISCVPVFSFHQTTYNVVHHKLLKNPLILHSTTEYVNLTETEVAVNDLDVTVSDETLNQDDDTLMMHYQKHAEKIKNSFKIVDFNPAGFSQNNHFQTISGAFLRNRAQFAYWDSQNLLKMLSSILIIGNEKRQPDEGFDWYDERERIDTPDDDFFDVDYKYVVDRESRGTVIVVHGFESNSGSKLIIDMAKSYLEKGFNVACKSMNLICYQNQSQILLM